MAFVYFKAASDMVDRELMIEKIVAASELNKFEISKYYP